jgi:hypothetical protein
MRAFIQRLLPFALVSLAAVLSGRAAAQSDRAPGGAENSLESAAVDALISSATRDTEEPDEVTVKGRKGSELGRYRLEMTKARDKIVEVFNKVNSTDDNDVKCRNERPTGTRMSHTVCRSRREDAADAAAAKGFLDSLVRRAGQFITVSGVAPAGGAPPGGPQVNALVGTSSSRQEGAGGEEQARANLEAEMKKLMAQSRELYRSVVKYVEARDEYNKARGQGDVVLEAGNPVAE